MTMKFVLTLHSHLPWVLHHGRWPHGSDWITEATLDTYLPLLGMLDEAAVVGSSTPITLGITPVLAAQLAHPSFREEVDTYFAHRLETLATAADSLRETGDTDLLPLVPFWTDHILRLQRLWVGYDRDLISAFRRHAASGRIELISSAATHGFLPLLARDESIRLQLLVGRAEHLRLFGKLPTGCWAPECAYRPSGPWNPWPGAPSSPMRTGIETHLRHAGFRWFFVDAHLAEAGEAWELYEGKGKLQAAVTQRSPYRAYQVGSHIKRRQRPVHVLVRDPMATAQVWSRQGGYPGDGRYLDFHKIRYPGGLKLWAVTDPEADLGAKAPYRPQPAQDATQGHARHFKEVLKRLDAVRARGDEVIGAPFDTELFGHWWFEGVDFLGALFRELEREPDISPETATRYLAAAKPSVAVNMSAGSWGANGDFSKWLNPETAWTWLRLWPLENRFWDSVPSALTRPGVLPVLEQAARELLLAQSSDWQFIISTGAAGDYATKRFNEHCDALERLLPALESTAGDLGAALEAAAALQEIDGLFPSLVGAIAAASDVAS
jgi:1,4-alpha-glucan branching enzyme